MSASALDQITAFLRGKDLTAPQIAGVEGNLQVESGFRPTAYNPAEGAIGLAQWEGGRRANLQAFAKAAGTSETDLQTQLAFMWSELTGPEHGSLTALLGTSTAADAATVFDRQYERSSAASLPARVGAAQSLLSAGLQGGDGRVNVAPDSGSVQTVSDSTGSGSTLGAILGAIGGVFGFAGPGGAVSGGVEGSLGQGPGGALLGGLTQIGHWIVDGLLIVAGTVLIIVAIVLVARGGDSAERSSGANVPAPQPPAHERERTDAKAGASGAAEDAAEVAVA